MSEISWDTEVPVLAPRPVDANKGTFGHVLVVAGSRGMAGAAVLCGSSALRGGAGLVSLALPEGILPQVAAANPCYLTVPLPEDDQGRLDGSAAAALVERVRVSTVAVVGPGLGQGADRPGLLRALLEQTERPLVLDADGLNGIVGRLDALRRHKGGLVLTPHPGEFARLTGLDIPTIQADRTGHASRFAAEHGVVLVLKGHGTVVTDGRRVYRNLTGNPGMATGGTGDVLAGLTGALLAQGLDPFAAAKLAVYLHGLAGDLACAELGETSLIASDLLTYLPQAFRRHARPGPHT